MQQVIPDKDGLRLDFDILFDAVIAKYVGHLGNIECPHLCGNSVGGGFLVTVFFLS
jgi:hypothetical protein